MNIIDEITEIVGWKTVMHDFTKKENEGGYGT